MAIVDYLSGVVLTKSIEEVVLYAQEISSVWASATGAHGYRKSWVAPGFRLYYDGQPGMGCYLQVSGQGCADLVARPDWEGWDAFLSEFLSYGFRPSRIDLAFDDKNALLDMEEMRRKLLAGEVTTRYRSVSPQSTYLSGNISRDCIYLGTMKSDSSCCIYDKRLERLAAGEPDPGQWVRVEMRYKGEQAESVAKWIISNGGLDGAQGLLGSAIEFRDPDENLNQARWKISDFWGEFLELSAHVSRNTSKAVKTIDEHVARFTKQHSATLCMLVLALCAGSFSGPWLDHLLYTGFGRMNQRQHDTVRHYLGLPRSFTGPPTTPKGICQT